jgi:HAMP domain-containing protein
MLRRKLLVLFGSLVVVLAAMAVCAVWFLQGIQQRINHISTEAMAVVDEASRLDTALTSVEIDLYELQLGRERHLDKLIADTELVQSLLEEIGRYYGVHEPQSERPYRDLLAKYPDFERGVSSLATAQDVALARQYNVEALTQAMVLREDVMAIDLYACRHAQDEQRELASRFRWLVLGIALGALLIINATVLLLLRTAGLVLKPVDKLVEVTRQFTRERFDQRADLNQDGEFLELAEGYNRLAERIQEAEQRRMETIGQMALTLNHELNNAIAAIQMQLQVMGRGAANSEKLATCLKQVQEDLREMAKTVESLKHIRRIVLTDYIEGVKMLDLERSTRDEPAEAGNRAGASEEVP